MYVIRNVLIVFVFVLASRGWDCVAQTAVPSAVSSPSRSFPSVWDVIGIGQMRESIYKAKQEIGQIPLVRLTGSTLVDPLLQTTGLKARPGQSLVPASLGGAPFGANQSPTGGPGASGQGGGAAAAAAAGVPAAGGPAAEAAGPAPPPSPTKLAASLAAKQSEASTATTVAAIRFLAGQDCICYPETIDSLLGMLDDCNEVIRYEVLRALRRGCQEHAGNCRQCLPGGGPHLTCLCSTRVVARLSDLLLARDPAGRTRERSWRVRHLAKIILWQCLESTPIDSTDGVRPRPRPDPPIRPGVAN